MTVSKRIATMALLVIASFIPLAANAGASSHVVSKSCGVDCKFSTKELPANSGPNFNAYDEVDTINCPSSSFCLVAGIEQSKRISLNHLVMPASASIWNGKKWQASILTSKTSGQDQVSSASCPSVSFCVVGGTNVVGASRFLPFASAYRKGKWSTAYVFGGDLPITNGQVSAVNCVSSTFCVAAGNATYGNEFVKPVLSEWNGSSWTSLDVPNSYEDTIKNSSSTGYDSVACTSTTSCDVVGSYQLSNDSQIGIVAALRGSSWSFQAFSSFLGAGTSVFNNPWQIDCVSSNFCVIVGSEEFTNGSHAFVATFANGKWNHQLLVANLDANDAGITNSIACTSQSFCLASGTYGPKGDYGSSRPFTATWNGQVWTTNTNLDFPTMNSLSSVNNDGLACYSSRFCAMGTTMTSVNNNSYPMISLFNGKSWSTVTVARNIGESNGFQNLLTQIACPSSHLCIGVGFDDLTSIGGESWVATMKTN